MITLEISFPDTLARLFQFLRDLQVVVVPLFVCHLHFLRKRDSSGLYGPYFPKQRPSKYRHTGQAIK